MGRVFAKVGALALGAAGLGASMASAAGIERSAQSMMPLFETGDYVELSFSNFNPSVRGTWSHPQLGSFSSGDMAASQFNFSFAYKHALNENVDIAVIVDQPVGSDVVYPSAAAPYPYAGSHAEVRSNAVTGLVRYKFPSNVSVFGGLRAEAVKGNVAIKLPAGPASPAIDYAMKADTDYQFGYVIGVAWERPDIAARVALSYNSERKHSFDATEYGLGPTALDSTLDVTIPQSVNLEFQTGVAPDTLLFGSVRWVEWKAFDITPHYFDSAIKLATGGASNGTIASNDHNSVTYNIGIGRKFTPEWSGAIMFGYEDSKGDPVGNLSPTDGYKSIGIAATYTLDKLRITGGVRYYDIGKATTKGIGGKFKDADGIGLGLRVAYNF